ncbi:MAG TPA: translation initiation factor IF-2 [Chitinophagaceae bacterium]|nr:translation initiation factor IF-2 [Chitinophagaceae bacterium]HRF25947.1 translation initiation factor IF-2 [Ferruginibacter sp.]
MSEVNTPRLMAAAKEFNIGTNTLIEFLVSKNFSSDDLKPTSRLTEPMYRVLQAEFQQDKVARQKAEQIDLPKGVSASEQKKKKDEEDLSIRKKEKEKEEKAKAEEKKPEPVEEAPVAAPAAEKEEPVAETVSGNEVTKIEAPELEGPKIVKKIDLDAIDSSTRPKKTTKKAAPEEVTPAPVEETPAAPVVEAPVTQEEAPVVPEAPEATPALPPLIENIQAEKLTGPKILGKITLPVDSDTRPKKESQDEKHKRKRIPLQKKPGAPQRGPAQFDPMDRSNRGANRPGSRPGQGQGAPRREDKIIDEKEIQEKLKQTQAKLAGSGGRGKSLKAKYRKAKREEMAEQMGAGAGENNKLQVTEFVSVSELASLMDVSFADVISKCMSLGIMVSINQRLEADVIELVASEFGYEVEFIGVDDAAELEEEQEVDDPADLSPRPPIVTIMGHVDHGKTSLLDYIRNTNVIAGEAGGITQHIGAYEVTLKDGRMITFLDTPGHEAFTAMRARGAKVTDIAVIVVAADDAVMPQTKEAISHAQAAGVPMIFAINKVDKDGANPEKIKEQLAGMNILVESWGGKFQSQEISAKKGLNIDLLLEKILLETDILELKANPSRPGTGTVIEASLDKGRGYVATVLVQNGTLTQGDMIVSGQFFGKVKAMYNERNQRVETAPPSTPVLILGLNGAPQAGETFKVFADEAEARETAYKRGQILREQGMRAKKHITLDEIGRRLALGNFKELNVIIKGDVDGSVEALSDSLQKLSTEEIVVKVIHKAVGAITESDVTLANASDAIIIGFNVRPSMQAARMAEQESIQIKLYSIIYNAIEEIRSAMEGMLEPTVEEKILANVEIRQTYKFDKATVAGCQVLDGKIARNNRIRLVRDGIVIFTGELGSLKRFKDDAKEVTSGMECGLTIRNYNDIKVGDIVEAFEEVEVKRTL